MIVVQLRKQGGSKIMSWTCPIISDFYIKKVDFQLSGNLTDVSLILEHCTVASKKITYFWVCLLMTYTESMVTENESMHAASKHKGYSVTYSSNKSLLLHESK